MIVGRAPAVGSGTARSVASYAFSPLKLRSYRREFREGVYNPAYLLGTGLVIDQHGQALLLAAPEPDVFFDLEHLTKLEVIEDIYDRGMFLNHRTECRIFIHIHGFHAITLHRFKHDTASRVVSALLSIHDVPFTYRHIYHKLEFDGGGGSGGG
ncbi:MAG: hypothetical protein QF839_04855 [Candidatus Poseidoniaceae archaeon]|nr:hypothetical protein [Candidatus Poseidoniaceae archaeon]